LAYGVFLGRCMIPSYLSHLSFSRVFSSTCCLGSISHVLFSHLRLRRCRFKMLFILAFIFTSDGHINNGVRGPGISLQDSGIGPSGGNSETMPFTLALYSVSVHRSSSTRAPCSSTSDAPPRPSFRFASTPSLPSRPTRPSEPRAWLRRYPLALPRTCVELELSGNRPWEYHRVLVMSCSSSPPPRSILASGLRLPCSEDR
jgi:hypothetical protein